MPKDLQIERFDGTGSCPSRGRLGVHIFTSELGEPVPIYSQPTIYRNRHWFILYGKVFRTCGKCVRHKHMHVRGSTVLLSLRVEPDQVYSVYSQPRLNRFGQQVQFLGDHDSICYFLELLKNLDASTGSSRDESRVYRRPCVCAPHRHGQAH